MPEISDGRLGRRVRAQGPPPGTKGLARKGEVLSIKRNFDHPSTGLVHMSIRDAITGELRAIVHDGKRVEPADIKRERIWLNDEETKRLESRTSVSYWKQPKHWWRDRGNEDA